MTYYLKDKSNTAGAYPPPQAHPGPDTIPISEEQRDMVVQYNGFVTVRENRDEAGAVSYSIEPDTEAWEAWKASLPPETGPEPTDTEVLNTLLGVEV